MTARTDVDEPGAEPGSGPSRRLRRLTGVLPVALAVVVIAAAALLVSPSLRHELGISFARQHEHYVELFFTDERAARTCKVTPAGDVVVRAAVTSHLASAQSLTWTARLTPETGTSTNTTGTLDTTPDRTTRFGTDLPAPSGPYTVIITLGSRSERLVLHC